MLNPTRFRLTTDQVAAALALADLRPTGRSALPLNRPSTDPVALLRGSGVLEPDGRLTDLAAATLRVAADPAHVVVVTANRAGLDAWTAALVLRGSADETYVLQAGLGDGGFDFAVLPTLTQTTVLVDELLDLTAFGEGAASATVDLDLCAFTALLAAADAAQEARLTSMLARHTESASPLLTAAALEEQLDRGLAATDTRWAVSAAKVAVPVTLRAARGRMADGLEALAAHGLAENGAGGYRLTDRGGAPALDLSRLVTTGGIAVLTDAARGQSALAHLTMFRSPFSTWFVFWTGLADGDLRAGLFQTTAEIGLRLVRSLLDPLQVEELSAGLPPQRREAEGGERVPAREKAPPWSPTHLVPAGGMSAWSAPDPAAAPVARLAPGVELRLLERAGDWAHIVCYNGWSAWVDGRVMADFSSS